MRTIKMNPIGGERMKDVQIKEFQMEDPTFEDGTVHVAHVTFINPKNQAITYSAVLYLAAPTDLSTPITESSEQTFTVAAGGTSAPVDFSVLAPLLAVAQATFLACIRVSVAGTPIVLFTGAESIIVYFSPAIDWGDITWD